MARVRDLALFLNYDLIIFISHHSRRCTGTHIHVYGILYAIHGYYLSLYQVLSESVSKAMSLSKNPETAETVKFILIFDKFFDAMNVNNFKSGYRSRKAYRKPYQNSDDERLKVS